MSFPFYSRSSSKTARTKDAATSDTHSQRASTTHATVASKAINFEAKDDVRHESPGHARSSSKMRIFPFLGKKRKSIAALRTSGISVIDFPASGSNLNGPDVQGSTHYKTVSQLANETAARMARSSAGPGASLSTELPPLSVSPLRIGLDAGYSTPPKNAQNMRHSVFSSGSTANSATPTKTPQQTAKRASDKPKSFLSRVTSRPSLTFRYSSADLKSGSKPSGRLFSKAPEKTTISTSPNRPIIMVPVDESVQCRLGEDHDFFTSPRAAPTPPNLTFTPSQSLSQESLLSVSRPLKTYSIQGNGHSASEASTVIRSTEDFRRRVKQSPNRGHESKSPSVASQASLSPDLKFRSVDTRSGSHSRHLHSTSSATISSSADESPKTYLATPRSRGGVVRIGREEVTLSVANVLESELGVDVGDSEEESEYGEESHSPEFKSTSPKRFAALGPPPGVLPVLPDSSDLPRLCPSGGDLVKNKALDLRLSVTTSQDLEAQSPLSALISGTPVNKHSSTGSAGNDSPHQKATRTLEHRVSSPPNVGRTDTDHHSTRMRFHRPNKSLGGLDRISELDSDKSCSPRESLCKNEVKVSDEQINMVANLQQSLDTQCARFDRLARHLLDIIQRHTTEKLTLENRITALEKDVKVRDREIKGLRWLVDTMKKASEEKRNSSRHGRSLSMQSLTSGMSGHDKQADLSTIAAMLSTVERDDYGSRIQDSRASMEVSPDLTTSKEKKILRRAKTLPDLHGAGIGRGAGRGDTPPLPTQSPSPDISGVGLGLEFPLPEPLTLRSIASTLLTTANSSAAVPALTAAPTAASGVSIATLSGAESVPAPVVAVESALPKRNRKDSSEKRKAGEWHPGLITYYRPPPETSPTPSMKSETSAASMKYASNLNKGRSPTITHVLKKAGSGQSMDFDSVLEKLVANAEEFLDH